MNDEIQEILKEIECYKNEELCLILLSQKENKALLDYISNLQQIEKEYKSKVDDIGKLTSRIYKAIEYVESQCREEDGFLVGYGDDLDPQTLLNILQNGSDKEY